MKANELRIGNLVTFHKGIIPIEPLMIYDIHNATNKAMFYEPIPLTEEWLVNFGFRHSGNGFYDLIGKHLSLANIGNVYFRLGFKGQPIKNIYHVHDLQNLYHALTGEELTIKTNKK